MVGASAVLLAGLVASRWIWSFYAENRRLQAAVERREQVIGQLEQEGARLALELGAANTQLSETAGEVDQLNQTTQGLGEQIGRLTTEIDQVQASYRQVREEREQLMQRVLEIEQERASLASRLSSIPELRRAIEDAIEVRKQARQAERLTRLSARRSADRELAQGNRGYVIREGRPTVGLSTVWVRVHEPEPSP